MRTLIALLIIAAALPAEEAEQRTLTIGDPAPALDIAHWIKGEGKALEEDSVTVVECWATWCGPCRAGMPHLSELQAKHAEDGVTIVGVSNEPLETVTEFLGQTDRRSGKTWSEVIQYTLATDPDKSVWKDYLDGSGQSGIPCAFVVGKDNHIEWIGHPMHMDAVLEAIVAGTWDRKAAKQRYEDQQGLEIALNRKDWDRALQLLDAELEEFPEALELQLQKFMVLLTGKHDDEAAYAFGAKVVEGAWQNANVLNSIAWTVVDDKGVKSRDLDFAMKAAVQANALTDSKDAAILDTLARVWFEKGDLATAVEWQRKAVERAQPGRMRDELQQTLDRYEAAADGE